jgi:hypothetical protein
VPRGDVPLHGGDDLRTQARHCVEHCPVARPVGQEIEVREIEQSPLLPLGVMPDGQAGLGQDRALILGSAALEGPIRLQALCHDSLQL